MRSMHNQLVYLIFMVRFLTCILLMVTMGLTLRAQQITTSAPIDFNVRNEGVTILGANNDIIYTHLYNKSEQRVAAFRDNLSLQWNKSLPINLRRFDVVSISLEEDGLLGFFSEKRKDNLYIWGQRYDFNLDSLGNRQLIDTIPQKVARSLPDIQVAFSQNRTYVVVYYLEEIFDQEDVLHYTRLSPALDIAAQAAVALPTDGTKHAFHDLLVRNNGEVLIITADFKDSGKDHATRYTVQRSANNHSLDAALVVNAGTERFLNNTQFKVDDVNETLVATGFYTLDYRQPIHAEGVYFQVYTLANQALQTSSFQELPADFIAKIKGVRNPKRANKLYTFIVDDVILRQDGGVLLIAESFYRTYRANAPMYDIYGMPMRAETTITYHFDEVIVLSLHPDGSMHWKNILIKAQHSTGDYGRYGSYALMNTGKYLLFLFNDDLNSRTNVVQYAVDGTGTISRNVLLNARKYNVYLLPQFARQVSARTVVIPSIRKNELRLVKVAY